MSTPSWPSSATPIACPAALRTDDDPWRLLSRREVVREPVSDRYGRGYRPIGGFSGPGRFGSPYQGLMGGIASLGHKD